MPAAAKITIRDRIKELRRVPARSLVPNPKNWRTHPKAQADALRGILAEVGYADALIARETPAGLVLIDGHLRAETTPDQEVPVLVLDVTEEEADKILLTLDPLAGMAAANDEALKALAASVRFKTADIEALLRALGVKRADSFKNRRLKSTGRPNSRPSGARKRASFGRSGRIGLLCADCRERTDVARLWRDGSAKFRMVWTDPPYGVDYAGKNEYLNRGDRGNRIQKQIENDRLSADECQKLFAGALTQAQAWAMPGAVCYATVPSGPLLVRFIAGFGEGGFDFRHLLVWVKQQSYRDERLPLPARADPVRLAAQWTALLRQGPEPEHHLRSRQTPCFRPPSDHQAGRANCPDGREQQPRRARSSTTHSTAPAARCSPPTSSAASATASR